MPTPETEPPFDAGGTVTPSQPAPLVGETPSEYVPPRGALKLPAVHTGPIDPSGDPPTGKAICRRDFKIPVPDIKTGTPTHFAAGQEVTDPALLTLFVRYVCPVEWAKEV